MKKSLRSFSKSIRTKLLIGSLVWLLLSVVATSWVLTDLFDNYSKRQLASELNVQMNQLLAAFSVNNEGQIQLDFPLNDSRFEQPLSGLYWQINHIDNVNSQTDVLRSRSLWDQILIIKNDSKNTDSLIEIPGPKDTKLFAKIREIKPIEGQSNYNLIIAIDQNVLDPVTNRFNLLVSIFLGLLAITIAIALLIQIWLSLKPIANLRHKLDNVLNGVDKQIQGDYPSEIQPLVNAFNRVLKANEDMVVQARAQAGNLAHALKTPLTIIANSVATDDSAQGYLIKEQIKSAQHHIGHHLSRARATAIGVTQNKYTKVDAVVAGLLNTLERLYRDKGIDLHLQAIPEQLAFIGDANDLQEMLGNLIDNAYKWTSNNIWLDIVVDKHNKQMILAIEDDGAGLSRYEQNQLFKRGIRLDEQTPGSGLGLAIVSDLAAAYGGSVSLDHSNHGGLKVILALPAKLLTNAQK